MSGKKLDEIIQRLEQIDERLALIESLISKVLGLDVPEEFLQDMSRELNVKEEFTNVEDLIRFLFSDFFDKE
jgi:hypothetical protein